MNFLRDPMWQFLISSLISIAGIFIPILLGIVQKKNTGTSSSNNAGLSTNSSGCWILPVVALSIMLIIFVIFSGTVLTTISNIIAHFPPPQVSPNQSSFGSVFQNSPDQVLSYYCSGIQSGDDQEAYNQYSDQLKHQVSSTEFLQMWSNKHISSCLHDPIQISGNLASSKLTMQDFFTHQNFLYKVTLVQESSGNWKINSIAAQ